MIIYEIVGHYFDGGNNFTWTEGRYLNKDKAEYECELLIEANPYVDQYSDSYYVSTEEVNEEVL
jgi:hypothetical protein